MCIIAAKPKGVKMPSRDTIRTMWDSNRDGAGLMYVENGKVQIEKGFMKYKHFAKKLDELEARLDLTETPLIMHFRITTHGGTKPENTHPFPISDNINALGKLRFRTDIGVAHNGIITIDTRKGISDTMEYIASQLAPLKRAVPKFYLNKDLMCMVKNGIQSKMAFLTSDGSIYTIGDFNTNEGMLYSNYTWEKYTNKYRNLSYGYYDAWGDGAWSAESDPQDAVYSNATYRRLMWLPGGAYVNGDDYMDSGDEYLIDRDNRVYYYDSAWDCATPSAGVSAYTSEGVSVRFNDNYAELFPVV